MTSNFGHARRGSRPHRQTIDPAHPHAKPGRGSDAVATAIRAEPRLTQAQKEALLAVYSSYLTEGETRQNSVD
jgi:hypothetical protein